MMIARRLALPVGVAALASLAACATGPRVASIPPAAPAIAAPAIAAAPLPGADAIPRVEPRSRYGNPPYYDVFGKRYYVLSSSSAYVARGVASWYGPGFHKVRTSTGEPYDMYAMTAAHTTLPLPAYVRVTNLQNGRSVVVRVNDRGPFVGNRIIDVSYAAAVRLDMLRNGTALVEVRAIDPGAPAPGNGAVLAGQSATTGNRSGGALTAAASSALTAVVPSAQAAPVPAAAQAPISAAAPAAATATASGAALFVQAGAFADPANADRLVARLRGAGYGSIVVRPDVIAGRTMYRVRIGPVPNVPEFDRIVAGLEQAGVHDAHLALE